MNNTKPSTPSSASESADEAWDRLLEASPHHPAWALIQAEIHHQHDQGLLVPEADPSLSSPPESADSNLPKNPSSEQPPP